MAHKPYAERYEGVFGSMTFPPYEYQEYPKYVQGPNGRIIVHNRAQELEYLAYVPARQPTVEEGKELAEGLQAAQAEKESLAKQLEETQKKLAEALTAKNAPAETGTGKIPLAVGGAKP